MMWSKLTRAKKGTPTKGFSLVEVIIGAALFSLISIGVYQSYATLTTVVSVSRMKIIAADLANEQLELIRNLPFSSVGLIGGIPAGVINPVQTFERNSQTFVSTTTIRNIDDPFDGLLGESPNDLSPADYKLVEIEIFCTSCKEFSAMNFTTRVAPKNLETSSSNGALFIKVFDANGVPVQGADVQVKNPSASPEIDIHDVTNAQGMLQIVDVPPGINAYQISVTKSGYTQDETMAAEVGNPNPAKPHATVVTQQVTQVSFVIDKVSTVRIAAVSSSCAPVPNLSFTLRGSKTLGTNPTLYKYEENHTLPSSGELVLSDMEWDTYSLTLTSGADNLSGVNPLLPVAVLPDATQNIQMIIDDHSPRAVLVSVKDSATGLPLSGASVSLEKSGFSETLLTGRGFLNQTDWSGGGGQETMGDPTRYSSSNGNVAVNDPAGDLHLAETLGDFAPAGILTSSTFDSGTTSNFYQLSWSPTSQPTETGDPNVRFQVASNNDAMTWNFLGPDGTGDSFYTTSNSNVSSAHDNTRYFRYRALLNTEDQAFTPTVSDVGLTFTSACIPPGQVHFTGLGAGQYTVTASLSGYGEHTGLIDVSQNWQQYEIILYP